MSLNLNGLEMSYLPYYVLCTILECQSYLPFKLSAKIKVKFKLVLNS